MLYLLCFSGAQFEFSYPHTLLCAFLSTRGDAKFTTSCLYKKASLILQWLLDVQLPCMEFFAARTKPFLKNLWQLLKHTINVSTHCTSLLSYNSTCSPVTVVNTFDVLVIFYLSALVLLRWLLTVRKHGHKSTKRLQEKEYWRMQIMVHWCRRCHCSVCLGSANHPKHWWLNFGWLSIGYDL